MGNPICPKCGRTMTTKLQKTGQKGLSPYWVCPNKNPLHGKVRYLKGAQTIPPYRGKQK